MFNYKIFYLVSSSLLCSLGIMTMAAIFSPSFAQNQQSTIDPTLRPNEPGSTIGGSNGGLNMFDLILRSQNAPSRDANEVSEQQRRSLDNNSEEFRRQQLERLRNLGAAPNSSNSSTPNSTNP